MKITTKFKIERFLRRIKNKFKRKSFKVKLGDQFIGKNHRGLGIAYIVTDIQKLKSTKNKRTKVLYELNGINTVEEKQLKQMERVEDV